MDVENPQRPVRPGDEVAEANALESLLRIAQILRRRWLVIFAVALLVVATAALGIATMKPYWRASVTLVINANGPQILDTVQGVHDDQEDSGLGYKRYAATQAEIIHSRLVASQALAQLGLEKDLLFLGVDEITDPVERQRTIDKTDPVDQLRETISVSEVGNSRILRISAEYPDPAVAMDIANTVANTYLSHVTNARTDTGVEAKDNVAIERDKARTTLTDAEASLDKFKDEHRITSISLSDRQNVIAQNISTLTSRAKQAQAEVFEAESVFEEAQILHKQGSLASASLVPTDQRVLFTSLLTQRETALSTFTRVDAKYGERHPDHIVTKAQLSLIDTRLATAGEDLLSKLKAKRNVSRQTERKLKGALLKENDRALELGRLEPEYRALEREAKNAASTYEVLAKRDVELGLSNRVEEGWVQPVELLDLAPLPGEPVRPRRGLLLFAALLLGLGFGSLAALAADLRDQRIRSLSELGRLMGDLGLQVLGHIPLLSIDQKLGAGNVRAQRRRRDMYAHLHPQSHMAERTRAVRTTLAFNLPPESSIALLVTSPNSGEGKSSIATNLALSYTQANKKVVLVGGDMRRPRLHHVFPPSEESHPDAGLAAVLTGAIDIDQSLDGPFEGLPEGLRVLTCGPPPGNPAEILDSTRFRRLIQDLKRRFDVVLIDSPPVLPVVDPLIMAPHVDGVVMVARCASTTRHQLNEALAMLRQGDTNLLGVVLNQVDTRAEGDRYGYYGEYYGREAGETADA